MDGHAPGLFAPADRTPPPRFVTDVVLELGLASHDDVHAAVEAAKTTGARAEAVLVQHGVLDDERLALALAERYGLDRLDLDHFPVDHAAAALVSVGTALRHEALPVAHVDGGRMLVAGRAPGRRPSARGGRRPGRWAGGRRHRAGDRRRGGAGRRAAPPTARPDRGDREPGAGAAAGAAAGGARAVRGRGAPAGGAGGGPPCRRPRA